MASESAASYECLVCKIRKNLVGALHMHHMDHHSVEELSLALLKTQGLLEDDEQTWETDASFSDHHDAVWSTQSEQLISEPLSPRRPDTSGERRMDEYGPGNEALESGWDLTGAAKRSDEELPMNLEIKRSSKPTVSLLKRQSSPDKRYKNLKPQKKWIQRNDLENAVSENISYNLSGVNNGAELTKNSSHLYLALLNKRNEARNKGDPQAISILKNPMTTKVLPPLVPVQFKKTSPSKTKSPEKHSSLNPDQEIPNNEPNVSIIIRNNQPINGSLLSATQRMRIDTNVEGNDQEDIMISQPPTHPVAVQSSSGKGAHPIHPVSSDRRWACPTCGSGYKKKSHLDRHIRSHTGERPFQCSVCNKSFAIKSVLSQHMRTHTGEKPFECSVCNARFPQTSALMTHMMLHTGKPYKCDLCVKAFVSNHKLMKHMKVHSELKPHKCVACNLGFFTLTALHEHRSIVHLNEKKFVCDICHASFKLEVSLKVHLDGHIGEMQAEQGTSKSWNNPRATTS